MSSKKSNPARICTLCDRKWTWEYVDEFDDVDECTRCTPRDEYVPVHKSKRKKFNGSN